MAYVPYSSINPQAASKFVSANPTEGVPWVRDYHHADLLYRSNNYDLAPKAGFIYFVDFNVNPKIAELLKDINPEMLKLTGLLAKSVQLPKFKISTDTLNQYNRKTNVQTKINYEPVRLEFHDDNASNTNSLWQAYYKYYYEDSVYAPPKVGTGAEVTAFSDTKFGNKDYAYGYRNLKQESFFKSIDLYILHRGQFTSMSLVNPIITAWEHDTLDQSDATKMLKNSMSLSYEDVFYDKGFTLNGARSTAFIEDGLYDTSSSPLIYPTAVTSNVGDENAAFKSSQYSNVKPPATGALTKSLIGLSATLRGINIARQLINNRHQAWQVYGFNIKTVVTNKLADAVFAAASSVTTQPLGAPTVPSSPGPTAQSDFKTTE